MCAQDASTIGAAPTKSAPGAPMDPWLRMRLAPLHETHRPAVGGATVRDALCAIADARPDPALLALELRPVRALLDRERGRLRRRLADGAPDTEVAHAQARLLDGTIIGLCHLLRVLEPRPADSAPPLAVVARGDYARRRLAPGTSADVLFLVAPDPMRLEQGLAAAQFLARELSGLGWQLSGAKRSVRGCLAEMHLDPAIGADLAAGRLVWGCHRLFADLRAGLGQAMHRQGGPIAGVPERSARPVLAA